MRLLRVRCEKPIEKLQLKKFPYEIRDVDAETTSELLKFYTGERKGFVQVGPKGYFLPYKYKNEAEMYYNFEARRDDIWIVSIPSSGSTWTQEMIWLLANDLNFDLTKYIMLAERFPYFELPVFLHDAVKKSNLTSNNECSADQDITDTGCQRRLEALSNIERDKRRFIKTHLPLSLLPYSVFENNCKIIYVARNPKDLAVSYYHLHRLYRHMGYNGDFRSYWRHFQDGLSYYMPYNSHLNEAKEHRHLPNFLFLNYEDALRDLTGYLNKIGDFLERKPSARGLKKLLKHLNIQNFRQNKSVNMHQMRDLGLTNENEAEFKRRGVDSTNGKTDEHQEFLDNPDLLQSANDWVQHYNTNFRNL